MFGFLFFELFIVVEIELGKSISAKKKFVGKKRSENSIELQKVASCYIKTVAKPIVVISTKDIDALFLVLGVFNFYCFTVVRDGEGRALASGREFTCPKQ